MTKELLTEKINYAEQVIAQYMPPAQGFASKVIEAMNYSVNAGGKRIRPIMLKMVFDSVNKSGEVSPKLPEPFMAAMEMIHTYSLIHDDLPAMDNDTLRRGLPTCHVKFGEDVAILAGDGLLNYAYETAAKAFMLQPGSEKVERAFTVLTRLPGLYGMLGGQSADVVMTGKKLTQEELEYIYENKTAALIECSMMIGAILAGASEDIIEKVKLAAYDIGMAFQVRDDILDVEGDAAVLGKEVGQDERNEKFTFVTIYGMDAAKKYVEEKSREAIELLMEIGADEELIQFTEMLINRDK